MKARKTIIDPIDATPADTARAAHLVHVLTHHATATDATRLPVAVDTANPQVRDAINASTKALSLVAPGYKNRSNKP